MAHTRTRTRTHSVTLLSIVSDEHDGAIAQLRAIPSTFELLQHYIASGPSLHARILACSTPPSTSTIQCLRVCVRPLLTPFVPFGRSHSVQPEATRKSHPNDLRCRSTVSAVTE